MISSCHNLNVFIKNVGLMTVTLYVMRTVVIISSNHSNLMIKLINVTMTLLKVRMSSWMIIQFFQRRERISCLRTLLSFLQFSSMVNWCVGISTN